MPTKVLLVDDHTIIREGLKALLEKQPDIVVVGSVEDGRQAVATVHKLAPDLVIMDISMPNLNGIDATRKITEENRSVKIIALSIHSSRRLVSEMLKAGASGYILKYCLFDELIDAINTVLKGNIYLSPKITGIAIDNYVQHIQSNGAILSGREREVLQLLAEGKSTKQIALQLKVSAKTIEWNRSNIMDKLGINNLAELTKYAVREGLTPLDSVQ
jgi:two-component system, NarL family, response regulator NreC